MDNEDQQYSRRSPTRNDSRGSRGGSRTSRNSSNSSRKVPRHNCNRESSMPKEEEERIPVSNARVVNNSQFEKPVNKMDNNKTTPHKPLSQSKNSFAGNPNANDNNR